MLSSPQLNSRLVSERIRVRGTVQGVGFRPLVWRLARAAGLVGEVCNDGEGVLIEVHGGDEQIDNFLSTLRTSCPPLASIAAIERELFDADGIPDTFSIASSRDSLVSTQLPADAATCDACLADMATPGNRRFAYPFTNCTHCGPRLSIVRGIPYDRANTTMASFPLCVACAAEYDDPADRRFHAQPNACPDCGPMVWLEVQGERTAARDDALQQAAMRIRRGEIVAIKGIGGFHLAVDAANADAVAALRLRKRRPAKPLALMARDVAQIRQWCKLSPDEAAALQSPAAPVVLLPRCDSSRQEACPLAPGQGNLGFMLPYSPLHHLLLAELDHPIVLTSGNLSSEPQCIDNNDARTRLQGIADAFLLHDRDIANRIDDSVIRTMGGTLRMLRRARGYAPEPVAMPAGFSADIELLAMGGELKNTFCLVKNGQAILSQHMGDLSNFATGEDYRKNLDLFSRLYQHRPQAVVVDRHPDYLSSRLGDERASENNLALIEVQHHHAHVAACLAENGVPLNTTPVLGIVLDGLGYGDDGAIWGGEFLLSDYRQASRLASLRATPLPGGDKAMREPWRNLWAQLKINGLLDTALTSDLPLAAYLSAKPLATLDAMLEREINSPSASSTGRLFDAVAAALGICADEIQYEGQAAIELEALQVEVNDDSPYTFASEESGSMPVIDPAPMWQQLLEDLRRGVSLEIVSHRFHHGFAAALVEMGSRLVRQYSIDKVVLSGGVFQNRTLFDAVVAGFDTQLEVLTHRLVPPNDGGLALGQAAVGAARLQTAALQ